MKILIDPGHGGKETGAIGPTGLMEKDVNLRVAYYLKDFLQNDNFDVSLTRTKDITLTLAERVEIAKKLSPCLFLSIHHNANAERNAYVNRFEVFVPFSFKGPAVSLGKKLAEIFSKRRGQIPLGPLPARYTVLKSSPFSVLVEPGYIINTEEEKRLRDDAYLKEEARLLYEGIKWALEDGCNFKLKLKRHTKREIIISKKGVDLASFEILFDDIPWQYYETDDENIRVFSPYSWYSLKIRGITHKGIEIFPFKYKNPEHVPIVSFSQSVREYGNLKLVHLSFFDNRGEYTKSGIKPSIKVRDGEIIKSSPFIEDKGSFYLILKTDRPENNIDISIRGFEATTSVRSIEDLRSNEIAGITEASGIPIENVLIKLKEGYTFSGKLGVFKTAIDKEITFIKKGVFPFYLKNPEPKKNYFVKMTPMFPGLFNKFILLRTSKRNNTHDANSMTFALILKEILYGAGAKTREIETGFPGWDNEPFTVLSIQKEKPDISLKIQSKENKLIFYYYYRDTDTLDILKRVASYFHKFDIPDFEIRESSDYFVIHPSGRRIVVNVPYSNDIKQFYLYAYAFLLGLEHYFKDEPITLEKIEAEGNFVNTEYKLFTFPVKDGYVFVPRNILTLKLLGEDTRCIHSPDGN